ncbi:tetratricopeptide repeat protein [Prochlorococcus sp. MIT 1341]|uniref:tetratricopeptide repeat protein n=1 Tax=Prochlorococcus sp. MIT 1341 TaxID=3096221 RepID=UPI002A75910B|nr:tetratricopeptide repeat protein [Prochlorococcus sp. MIT 1341]
MSKLKKSSCEIKITYNNVICFSFNKNRLFKESVKYLYDAIQSIKQINGIERGIIGNELLDETIKKLEENITLDNTDHASYFNLGFCYQLLNNHQKAIENYDKAIDISPDIALYYNNRGCSFGALEEFKKAQDDFRKSINMAPERTISYLNLADTLIDSRDNQNAIISYTNFINNNTTLKETDQTYVSGYMGRGFAYRRIEDKANAYLDWAYAMELGEASAAYFFSRDRLKDLTTHDALSELNTSEKLLLHENTDEYKNWFENEYDYEQVEKIKLKKHVEVNSLIRDEERKLKYLERFVSKKDYNRYDFCLIVLSYADSDGKINKQIADKLLTLHNLRWNDELNQLCETQLVKFGKGTKKIKTLRAISLLDYIGY